MHDRSSHADGKHEGGCHATSSCIAGTDEVAGVGWSRKSSLTTMPSRMDEAEWRSQCWGSGAERLDTHLLLGNSVAQQGGFMAYRHLKRRHEPKIAQRIANHQQATKLQEVKTVTRCVHRHKLQRALFQRRSCGCSLTHVTHCAHFSTFTVQGRIEKSFHQVVRR